MARITSDVAASRPGPEGAPATEDRKGRGYMNEGAYEQLREHTRDIDRLKREF
jgi:hypothetical protein